MIFIEIRIKFNDIRFERGIFKSLVRPKIQIDRSHSTKFKLSTQTHPSCLSLLLLGIFAPHVLAEEDHILCLWIPQTSAHWRPHCSFYLLFGWCIGAYLRRAQPASRQVPCVSAGRSSHRQGSTSCVWFLDEPVLNNQLTPYLNIQYCPTMAPSLEGPPIISARALRWTDKEVSLPCCCRCLYSLLVWYRLVLCCAGL